MSQIDPDQLEYLRNDLIAYVNQPHYRPVQAVSTAKQIKKGLSAMGLDLDQDATYELLEDGLSKADFEERAFLCTTHWVAQSFLSSQDLAWQDYCDVVAISRYNQVNTLLRLMDEFSSEMKSTAMPAHADPHHKHIIEYLIAEYDSGSLAEYKKDLAVDGAAEVYKRLQNFWANLKPRLQDKSDYNATHALQGEVFQIRNLMDLVGDMDAARLPKFLAKAEASSDDVNDLYKEIAIAFAAFKITDEPLIPTDDYGELSYQTAIDELTKAGVDMSEQATYDDLDIDKQDFWDNYQQQIDWQKASGTHHNKPAIVHQPC